MKTQLSAFLVILSSLTGLTAQLVLVPNATADRGSSVNNGRFRELRLPTIFERENIPSKPGTSHPGEAPRTQPPALLHLKSSWASSNRITAGKTWRSKLIVVAMAPLNLKSCEVTLGSLELLSAEVIADSCTLKSLGNNTYRLDIKQRFKTPTVSRIYQLVHVEISGSKPGEEYTIAFKSGSARSLTVDGNEDLPKFKIKSAYLSKNKKGQEYIQLEYDSNFKVLDGQIDFRTYLDKRSDWNTTSLIPSGKLRNMRQHLTGGTLTINILQKLVEGSNSKGKQADEVRIMRISVINRALQEVIYTLPNPLVIRR